MFYKYLVSGKLHLNLLNSYCKHSLSKDLWIPGGHRWTSILCECMWVWAFVYGWCQEHLLLLQREWRQYPSPQEQISIRTQTPTPCPSPNFCNRTSHHVYQGKAEKGTCFSNLPELVYMKNGLKCQWAIQLCHECTSYISSMSNLPCLYQKNGARFWIIPT